MQLNWEANIFIPNNKVHYTNFIKFLYIYWMRIPALCLICTIIHAVKHSMLASINFFLPFHRIAFMLSLMHRGFTENWIGILAIFGKEKYQGLYWHNINKICQVLLNSVYTWQITMKPDKSECLLLRMWNILKVLI